MILMWLGSFVLVLFSVLTTQKYLNKKLMPIQKKILTGKDKEGDLSLVIRNASVVLTEVSPLRTMFSAIAKINTQVGKEREALIQLCMAPLGYWWILILASLYLSLNGGFFLGVSILALVPFLVPRHLRQTFFFLGCLGLFLLGGELTLRNSNVLQNILGTSEFAFFLADGRFPAIFALMGLGIVIGFLVRAELCSLFLGMALLVTNNISLNGALGLFTGELIGIILFVLFQSFQVDQKTRNYIFKFSLASWVGIAVGFFVALTARSFFVFEFSGERQAYQDKLMTFVLLISIILALQTVAQMVWGHFAYRCNKVENVKVQYFPTKWFDWELISKSQTSFFKEALSKRLSEIKYHSQGVKTLEDGKIPESILARLKTEEAELSRILNDCSH